MGWRGQLAGMRRIGVLMSLNENDPETRAYLSAFMRGLSELGWIDGRNLRMDVRWAPGSVDRMLTCPTLRLLDRMRRVDRGQAKRYRQRTGQ